MVDPAVATDEDDDEADDGDDDDGVVDEDTEAEPAEVGRALDLERPRFAGTVLDTLPGVGGAPGDFRLDKVGDTNA
jgi:hypothetical protein